jgi:glycosyltransferase involved in cell wall biosynthesis
MKNILAIAPYKFLPAQSGGQKGIFLFYKYLVNEANIYCVSTQNNDLSNTGGINVSAIFSNSSMRYINLFYFFKLKKIISKNNIDTIIIEHPYMGMLGILLQFFCKKNLIIHSHNIETLRFKNLKKWWWRLLFSYEKTVHRMADFSFFITEEDRQYALRHFHLTVNKTTVITYGTEIEKALPLAEKKKTVTTLKKQFHIAEQRTLLLFNGVFGYGPNDKALYLLLQQIMPALLAIDKNFALLICGKNIPEEVKRYASENIIIKGFVDDIDAVFKGAEIFLNPIWTGGGIKTKLVEALSFGTSAVSFKSGAIGIPTDVAGDKLKIVEDEDVTQFAQAIIEQRRTIADPTVERFYHHFYWKNIAKKTADFL